MSDPVTKIATVTPTGTAITQFNSIPGTYDDLMIIGSSKNAYTGAPSFNICSLYLRVNSDTNTNYSWNRWGGAQGGGEVTGSIAQNAILLAASSTSESSDAGFGHFYIYIPGYKVASVYKQMQLVGGFTSSAGAAQMGWTGHAQWSRNDAITDIEIRGSNTTADRYYVTGTTMTLYGISNS